MKNVILSAIAMAFVVVSCNQKKKVVNDETVVVEKDTIVVDHSTMPDHSKMYSCSMHPEIIGKMGDKCSKCGMELTEPVPEK